MKESAPMTLEPAKAATVILVREAAEGLEVYLLKRSSGSGFFPGNYVFPGGAVDPEDRDGGLWTPHIDMDMDGVSLRLGGTLGVDEALAHGVAAVRETFEEAGVFLSGDGWNRPDDIEGLCGLRMTGGLSGDWLRERVVSEGWVLGLSLLRRWSHWITPEAMSRRFDTRFFLAFMPAGQTCVPDRRETVQGIWIGPERGIGENLAGRIPLSPPTLITLHELTGYGNRAELERELEARTWGEALLPRFIRLPEGAVIIEPWDPMYAEDAVEIDPEGLESRVLPPGEPFSRIWLHEGIWRPVK